MKSKYVDTTAAVNVIAGVYNNTELLDNEKYKFYEELFTEDIHKILFNSIYNLHALGAKEISIKTIEDYLETKPKKLAIYKAYNGADLLLEYKEKFKENTFDYYYGRLTKFCLLREYDKIGIDCKQIYDVDNIFDSKLREKQDEWLDNASLADITFKIENLIEEVKMKYSECVEDNSCHISEGIDELIESLATKPDFGYPLYGDYINTITRGARLGKLYLRSAATGLGKAIPNDTLIPTPLGWRKVGDIKPGDKLFGQDGKETTVLQIHPQPQKKEIWKVTFADGRVAECCGEHLWEYRYEAHRGYNYRVEDIQTIYNRTLNLKNGLKNSDGKGYRFHIKLNKPVEYEEKQYYLPPYTMGALLGDGCFRYNNTNKILTFSSIDEDIPTLISLDLAQHWQKGKVHTIYPKKSSNNNYDWTFRDKNNPNHPFWVEEMLRDYPELWNVKSEDKFIPREYLQGSIFQRQCLLQGLMDTDGSVDKKGRTSFTTISPQLRDDFIELCRSLGFITTYLVDKRDQYTTGECYTIYIQASKKMKQHFFRLARKHDIMNNYLKSNKREEYKDHLAIINIEKTNEKVDMTCFTVDNKDHLFLMNDFIVTHNTRMMIADACNFGCSEMYDLAQKKWVSLGPVQPTLFISTEQTVAEIQTATLAFLSGVDEGHIVTNSYEEGEKERVLKAAEILKNGRIIFESMPDFSLADIEATIKRAIRNHNVLHICYDYIHTSIKILEEITKMSGGVRLREDQILYMLGVRLKDLAVKYDVFIITATQLNGDYREAEVYDQNLLRGAKNLGDKIDFGCILLEASAKDKECLAQTCSILGIDAGDINNKMAIYKNRGNKYRGILAWIAADKGTCRYDIKFCTDYSYRLVEMPNIKIKVKEEGAFDKIRERF